MSPSLNYRPVFLGLYGALVLAIACNAFLDIQYGSFTVEVVLWAGLFAYTLRVGWKQHGQVSDFGRGRQKAVLIVGLILTVVFFMPVWGFPRAGLYLLGILQASMNCVTATRRNLYMGLLVSIVMVIFAASHFRADWTMLFYLLPYIAAVVFTLVAEQISRQTEDLGADGKNPGNASGQGAAIAAATATILLVGGALYAVTPQVSVSSLYWKYGQAGNVSLLGKKPGGGHTGEIGQVGPGNLTGGMGNPGGGQGENASGHRNRWPTAGEMRAAARLPGMPRWQASAIDTLADLAERTNAVLTPIRLGLDEVWNDFRKWLEEHRKMLVLSLLGLLLLALLVAAWLLLREARLGLWLYSRVDYFRLGLLGYSVPSNAGARQYYRALERLLDLHGAERAATANAREYLAQVCSQFADLRRETVELTLIFERARYGDATLRPNDVPRMRDLYRQIFRRIR